MIPSARHLIVALFVIACAAPASHAALWSDATDTTIGATAAWSNKVIVADLNGDGLADIIVANGGNYSSAGEPQQNFAFLNQGPGMPFLDVSGDVFGANGDLARSIKAADFNGDGALDLVVATTYQTQSRLYLGLGGGDFLEVTETHAPKGVGSFGDVEVGDLDGDGDLDIVFADWGPGSPGSNGGASPRLWLNDGLGVFTDATLQRMPIAPVVWSWDLELVDVDNDFDLDVLVSCKSCATQALFENDGDGYFDPTAGRFPESTNNYEFAAMDFDGDGDMDLATVNNGGGLDETLLLNDGSGVFTQADETLWPAAANVGSDDNVIEWLDVDSDGDADFIIGSLNGTDRLLRNDDGVLVLVTENVFEGNGTPGTLGMAFADFNSDGRLDVVISQGETADPEAVFMGADIAVDTAAPHLGEPMLVATDAGVDIRLRIHDSKSPSEPHDWSSVVLEASLDGEAVDAKLAHYGEFLWRATFVPAYNGSLTWRVCATDAASNTACTEEQTTTLKAFGDKPEPEPEPVEPTPEVEPEAAPEASPETAPEAAPDTAADAGPSDAADGGADDAVDSDAGATDNGGPDGTAAETGTTPAPSNEGCASSGGSSQAVWPALALLVVLWRRRRDSELATPS